MTTVSSMTPPLLLVYKLKQPVPSSSPAMSPTTRDSKKGMVSLPCRLNSHLSFEQFTHKKSKRCQRVPTIYIASLPCLSLLTFSVKPHMCDTSNSEACVRQCTVASIIESLYWMGIDQPAKSTILPARANRN